jgi:hypothetical protein
MTKENIKAFCIDESCDYFRKNDDIHNNLSDFDRKNLNEYYRGGHLMI